MIYFRKIDSIQAISFDLDDTLYDNYPIMRHAESRLLSYMAEHYTRTAKHDFSFWQSIKRQLIKASPQLKQDMGQLRLLALKTGFEKCGYSTNDAERFSQECFDYFYHHRSDFSVADDIIKVLETLAGALPLAAITNGNVNLEQIGIARFFKHIFHANLSQPMKPHPKMFNLTQQAMGLNPANILHVGDNLEKDVMGGRNAGFSTAWFACDRKMDIRQEPVTVLPDIQLRDLKELEDLI